MVARGAAGAWIAHKACAALAHPTDFGYVLVAAQDTAVADRVCDALDQLLPRPASL